MKEPNFFIIGAPKCGTTALATYLSKHPEVFMTNPKEPHHYNTDHRHGSYKDRDAYLSLFARAGNEHKAVGEASVWYLYSRDAVENILRDYPYSKFIVMLRNPIEMAPSLYRQQVFSGNEIAKTFSEAWCLQEARRKGEKVPHFCSEPCHLLYREVCRLGQQYERLLTHVDQSRLLTIIFEDLKLCPEKVWNDVVEFLGVAHDGREDFPIVNGAKMRRSLRLKRINDLYSRQREFLGFQGLGTGFFTHLDRWNRSKATDSVISPVFQNELKVEFRDDISLLSNLVGRDLSHWVSM